MAIDNETYGRRFIRETTDKAGETYIALDSYNIFYRVAFMRGAHNT